MPPPSVRGVDVSVRRASVACLKRLAQCDFSFEVVAELAEPYETGQTVSVDAPYLKNYGYDSDELIGYLGKSDAEVFIAEVSGAPVGYVAVSQGWNGFAVIEDIAVDASQRGNGLGSALMNAAVEWARLLKLAGVRLETQSNNAAACDFYRRYGFVLGGYDRHLYSGIHASGCEVALFWYLIFSADKIRT
ncbi:GNAT family N-acetyltransferase [Brucella cytisi]|uniref:GNAT family N-acetyltransferase n=1 Tax=Brucella cytisi TaxID=407152 RepID=UPI0035E2BC51